MKLVLALILTASTTHAQEFIPADGPLSDVDFYRLVACAAALGGDCQKEQVRWSPADALDVSVGFVQIEDGYPEDKTKLAQNALEAAILQVNAAGANIHLTLWDKTRKPDIGIHLLTIVNGDLIRNTGLDPLDGARIKAAKTQVWWRDDLSLIAAAIVIGSDIDTKDLQSIMLEEVTQSMGLLTDIGGEYYENRSIFSESSNALTELGRQDIAALRRHYQNSP